MIEKINENSDLVGGSSEQDKLGIKLLSYSLNKKYKICESLELVVGSGEQDYNHAFNRDIHHCCKEMIKFVKFVKIQN